LRQNTPSRGGARARRCDIAGACMCACVGSPAHSGSAYVSRSRRSSDSGGMKSIQRCARMEARCGDGMRGIRIAPSIYFSSRSDVGEDGWSVGNGVRLCRTPTPFVQLPSDTVAHLMLVAMKAGQLRFPFIEMSSVIVDRDAAEERMFGVPQGAPLVPPPIASGRAFHA
jgi:hypothetical protein